MIRLGLIFLAIGLSAAGFAAVPIVLRKDESLRARATLAGAAAFFVLGIGGGTYAILGHPFLAARTLEKPSDVNSLIPLLVRRVHAVPQDATSWMWLGRAYLSANDAVDAAKALSRAVQLSGAKGADPALLSAYGEALVFASGGAVPPDAENAFRMVLGLNPKDFAARFYLGLADAMRGKKGEALGLWQSLLADAPPNAPWRTELLDRVAALSASTGAAPDVAVMVAGLAERLKRQPDDPDGWQRLVRAYVVLGDKPRALKALADARAALSQRKDAIAALDKEAKGLALVAEPAVRK